MHAKVTLNRYEIRHLKIFSLLIEKITLSEEIHFNKND